MGGPGSGRHDLTGGEIGPPRVGGELTPYQRAFVDEYLIDWSATDAIRRIDENDTAAGRASGEGKNASARGSAMLRRPSVKAEIERRLGEQSERSALTVDRIVHELARIALADPAGAIDPETGAVLPMHEWPEDLRRTCSGLEVVETYDVDGETTGYVKKIRWWEKTKATDQLLRRLGAYIDRVQVAPVGWDELLAQAHERARKIKGGDPE